MDQAKSRSQEPPLARPSQGNSGPTIERGTYFLSPERAPLETVRDANQTLLSQPYISAMMDAFPEPGMIINRERQIVMANGKLEAMLGIPVTEMLGHRPGELLHCIHADAEQTGCGTSKFCKYCGAGRSIFKCQFLQDPQEEECRITIRDGDGTTSIELWVRTRPIEIEGETYTIFAVRNITDPKRREVLERIFFHDVLNMAGALGGLLDLAVDTDPDDAAGLTGEARDVSTQLIEDIQSQRDLTTAERGDLPMVVADVPVAKILAEVAATYGHQSINPGVTISVQEVPPEETVLTDHRLLRRVLGNLVKNAVEASSKGDQVSVRWDAAQKTFHVHNPSVMPEAVRAQVFNRSFSTKGTPGRGIGTYSVKLITEKYLGGGISFEAEDGRGTTFSVALPSE